MNPERSRRQRLATFIAAVSLAGTSALIASACGSSNSLNSPTPPVVDLQFADYLVDVGSRHQFDGSATTNPVGGTLLFAWTFVNTASSTNFDDRCVDVVDEICFSNDDDPCSDDPNNFCMSNADCVAGQCQTNGGTTSSDCSTGRCGLGQGATRSKASLVADVPGPYSVRLVAQNVETTGTRVVSVSTHPSLFVVGSLRAFGGTAGIDNGDFGVLPPDFTDLAQGAIRGVSNPADGNVLVIVPNGSGGGVVREFSLRSGQVIGAFGETLSAVTDPRAMAFGPAGRLYVADANGVVSRFQGAAPGKGILVSVVGDVTGAGQSVASLAFSPATGNLLVVDGGAGQGIRAYNATSGASAGVLGQTATAVATAVDTAFLPSYVCRHDTAIGCSVHADCEAFKAGSKCIPGAASRLLIADAAGDVISCAVDGTGCASFGSAAASLSTPTSIAINPSGGATAAKVLIGDSGIGGVIACDENGANCGVFGETNGIASAFNDIFYAPPSTPTTTTTTTSTTLP